MKKDECFTSKTDNSDACYRPFKTVANGDLLQVLRPKASLSRNAGQHAWTNLFPIVKREHHIRVTIPAKDAMGAGLPGDLPSDPQQHGKNARTLSPRASGSRGEQSIEVRDRLAVVETIRQHPQSQRLGFENHFAPRSTIGKHTRKVSDFGNPTAVLFLLGLQKKHPPLLVTCRSLIT